MRALPLAHRGAGDSAAPVVHQQTLQISTKGRGTYAITDVLHRIVLDSGAIAGICTVFIQLTSASLVLTENADPDVRRDLETWMRTAVRDGDPSFVHDAEGPDDMSAHVRT